MNLFDGLEAAELLPRRWKRRIGAVVLAFAVLFPGPFNRAFMHAVNQEAAKLTKIMNDVILSPTLQPTPPPTPTQSPFHAPAKTR